MANSFYNHSSGVPATQTRGSSLNIRAELDLIEDGFDAVETAVDLKASTASLAAKAPLASPTFTGTLAAAAATLSGLLTGAAATFSGLLTTNGQIKFPASQNASSDANTLDDYEEGTWTPGLESTGGVFAYTTREGSYTKIGNTVFLRGYMVLSSVTPDDTALRITGLPFAPSSDGAQLYTYGGGMVTAYQSMAASIGHITLNTSVTNSYLQPSYANGSDMASVKDTHVQATTVLRFAVTYRVS